MIQEPPSKVEIFYKLRSASIKALRLGTVATDPNEDMDTGTAGTQAINEIEAPFDRSEERYDLYYRPTDNAGIGPVIDFTYGDGQTTTTTQLNNDVTALVVTVNQIDAYTAAEILKQDQTVEIDSEKLVIDSWVDNGTTWQITFQDRGAHGTSVALHSIGATLKLLGLTTGVTHNSILLSTLANPLPAPTNLTATGIIDGARLVWDHTLTDEEKLLLKNYVLYYDDATIPAFNPRTDPIPAGVTRIDLGVTTSYVFPLADTTTTYYFRVTARDVTNQESNLSNEASASAAVITPPGDQPDPPDVSIVGNGGGTGNWLLLCGVQIAGTSTGDAGVTKIQFQIAEPGYSFSASTGFNVGNLVIYADGTAADHVVEGKRYLGTHHVVFSSDFIGGPYSITARVWNDYGGGWSDWKTPQDTGFTRVGVPDTDPVLGGDLPTGGAIKFTVFQDSAVTGIQIKGLATWPTTQGQTVWGCEVQATDNLSNWADDIYDTIGINTILASGTCDVVQGDLVLTNVSPALTAGAHVGKPIILYTSGDTATGKIVVPYSFNIIANTTTTITVAGGNPVTPFETVTGKFFIIYDSAKTYEYRDSFIRDGIGRGGMIVTRGVDTNTAVFGPWEADKALYYRMRWGSAPGLGQWIYYDGSTGTTTKASATTFTPTKYDTAALADGAVTTPIIDDLGVTTGKLNDDAVTPAKAVSKLQAVGGTVTFASVSATRFDVGLGSILLSDGTSKSISSTIHSGLSQNTLYYVYVIIGGSANTQATTTLSTIMGNDSYVLIGIARTGQTGTYDDCTIIPRWADGPRFSAADILANNIAAINVDAGELTAGTITGLLIRTAASGARIELTSSLFATYDGTYKRVEIPTSKDRINFYNDLDGGLAGYIAGVTLGIKVAQVSGANEGSVYVSADSTEVISKLTAKKSTNTSYFEMYNDGTTVYAGIFTNNTRRFSVYNDGAGRWADITNHPTISSGVGAYMYLKGQYFVIAYDHSGTDKYRYLNLQSTDATWTYSTTPP